MFIAHVFRIIARIAKGDGPINSAEVRFMDNLMTHTFKMTEKGRVHAIRLWNQSKVSGDSFDRLLGAFFTDFSRERHQVLNMMDLMFAAAVCDGGLNSREEALLVRAAEVFRISAQQYDRIKRRHVPMVGASWGGWSAMDAYYTILGCSPGDSLEAVKKKYRVLAMQWHPDRLQSKGLSSEAMRHAQEKFRQINEAWERIEAAHRSGSR
jgi:DnaJ like chaperone protein